MGAGKKGGCCEDRTPWERGRRAAAVKPEAMRCLGGVLKRFAGERGAVIGTPGECRDFRTDAIDLIRHAECRAWVARICAEHPGLTPCDAEAAITSTYLDIVARSFGGLYAAYWRFVINMLRGILRPALRAIRLRMCALDLREDVLMPMATFFFDSLRAMESDPNRLPWQPRRPLRKRPYGWSPVCDPLGSSLSLLLTRQGGGVRWSKALLYSPLAYCLRAAGIAEIRRVEQRFCNRCRKYVPDGKTHDPCPECGGRLRLTTPPRLLAKQLPSEAAERATEDGPSRGVERKEETAGDRKVLRRNARALWLTTMTGRRRDFRRMAVLLSLAGVDAPPDAWKWARPRGAWLTRIIKRLGAVALTGRGIALRAWRVLARLAKAPGMETAKGLSGENVRTILCRFRVRLRGGA